jgi:hypothetical protein
MQAKELRLAVGQGWLLLASTVQDEQALAVRLEVPLPSARALRRAVRQPGLFLGLGQGEGRH